MTEPHDPATEPAEGHVNERGLPSGPVPMVQPEDLTPFVTAYDPDMRVLYAWTNEAAADVSTLEGLMEVSPTRTAQLSIGEAALIRTREGVVLKDTGGLAGTSIAETDLLVLPEREEQEGRVIRHGRRRPELLQPVEVPGHQGLDEGEALLVALWSMLMELTGDHQFFLSDDMIARAKAPSTALGIERYADGWNVSAHQVEPTIIPLGEGDEATDGP